MKQIFVTDAQYEFLMKIAISHRVRVSSLVQIAVDMVFRPVVVNNNDLKLICRKSK